MNKVMKKGIVLLFILGLLVACGSQQRGESEKTEQDISQEQSQEQKEDTEDIQKEDAPVEEKEDFSFTGVKVIGLKGPTSFGIAPMVDAGLDYSLLTLPEEAVVAMTKKEADFALVPSNLAAVLYNKTEGGVKLAAINNLGVLYMVDNTGGIQSWEDLEGKTIYSTGKGATPDIVIHRLLEEKSVHATVEFKSEASEIAAMLAQEEEIIAVLPEPFITASQMKNDTIQVAMDLNREWEKTVGGSMVIGVLIVQKDFYEKNQETADAFIETFVKSVNYTVAHPDKAGQFIGEMDVVPAPVATKAIPKVALHPVTGEEMERLTKGYYEILFASNPKLVGGALPEDDFYIGE